MEVCPKLSITIYLNCVLEVHLDMRKRIERKKREKEMRPVKMGKKKKKIPKSREI